MIMSKSYVCVYVVSQFGENQTQQQQHSPTTIRDLATSHHSSSYLTQHTIIILKTNHAYEYIYIYVSYAWQWQWQWQWHVML